MITLTDRGRVVFLKIEGRGKRRMKGETTELRERGRKEGEGGGTGGRDR